MSINKSVLLYIKSHEEKQKPESFYIRFMKCSTESIYNQLLDIYTSENMTKTSFL